MEEKDIRYTGITQATSDLDCNDGDLSISHNMINLNGVMKPIVMPEPQFILKEDERLLYVHHTSEYNNYILLTNRKIGNHIHVYRNMIVCQYPTNVAIKISTVYQEPGDDLQTVEWMDIPVGTYKKSGYSLPSIIRVYLSKVPDNDIYEYSIGFTDRDYLESDGGWSDEGYTSVKRLVILKDEEIIDIPGSYGREEMMNAKFSSLGNTMIAISSLGIKYFLFMDGNYKYLGEKPPFVTICFGLKGELISSSTFSFDTYVSPLNSIYLTNGKPSRNILNTLVADRVTENVIPQVNKFIQEKVKEKGKLIFPFFIRYAYRLYDGNYYMQSSPLLMLPYTAETPLAVIESAQSDGSTLRTVDVKIKALACQISYIITDYNDVINELKNWKDIVKSIDFFISSPIYTYNQNGRYTMINVVESVTDFGQGYGLMNIGNECDSVDGKTLIYRKHNILSGGSYFATFMGAVRENVDIENDIEECANFYKIYSMKIENITSNSGTINPEEKVFTTLELQDRLRDDYGSHNSIIPGYSYIYNSRFNIANIRKSLYEGFPSDSLSCFVNGAYMGDDYVTSLIGNRNYIVYTYIRKNGKEFVVKNRSLIQMYEPFGFFLFYPDPDAYKMLIVYYDYITRKTSEVMLKKHKYLNGAYYFCGIGLYHTIYDGLYFQEEKAEIPNVTDAEVVEFNKLYTSEVNNPFYFPLEGINTIGVGEIIGMSSTTKALSQGQFGQFPLLVFSTDGIWAMEVSSTGLYSAKQPMSRDVCSNPNSITQIDGAVIFISDKGAMMINGAEVIPFSSELDGSTFDVNSVSRLNEIAVKEGIHDEISTFASTKDFFGGCKIAYDYPNSRLFFINENKTYAYVYLLDSHTWGTISSSFIDVISDYPNSYMQKKGGEVINISSKVNYDEDKEVKCMMLSRPIKLDGGMYKTINTVINRGIFLKHNKMAIVVFGSMDGLTYFPIGSVIGNHLSRLQGSAYRYFRIMTVGNFSMRESLSVTSLYYTPKWRNKPR